MAIFRVNLEVPSRSWLCKVTGGGQAQFTMPNRRITCWTSSFLHSSIHSPMPLFNISTKTGIQSSLQMYDIKVSKELWQKPHRRLVTMFPKSAPFLVGSGYPSNTWFLGLTSQQHLDQFSHFCKDLKGDTKCGKWGSSCSWWLDIPPFNKVYKSSY